MTRNDNIINWTTMVDEAMPEIKRACEDGIKLGSDMDIDLYRETEHEIQTHIVGHLDKRFNKGQIVDPDGNKLNLASVVVWCMKMMARDKRGENARRKS